MNRDSPILLIFHPGALGDGLLALPALRALKTKYPEHRIIWFGHKELGDVFVNAHEVHESYNFERLNILAFGNSRHSPEGFFSALFERCERVVGWMNDSDETWRSLFVSFGIKNLILQSPHDPILLHHHMADRYVETLRPWFSSQDALIQLEKSLNVDRFLACSQSKREEQPCLFKERLIVLHPGSGSIHKRASSELWANIAKGLMARHYWRVCLVGGPSDTNSIRKVQDLMTGLEPDIIEGWDLLTVGCFLRRASLFIGHDSGLSHLASRLGVPSILLFGPTDPARWAPRGSHVAVIRKTCHCVGKEAIGQCIDKHCFSISTNEVMAKVTEILGGINTPTSQWPFESLIESASITCLG